MGFENFVRTYQMLVDKYTKKYTIKVCDVLNIESPYDDREE